MQDYEPDFYPASAERMWAEGTYRIGLPCLAASPWLRDVVRERYGVERARGVRATASTSTSTARRRPARARRRSLFYARPATPRRATELGMLALDGAGRAAARTRA